jgi:hypothetical protein
MQTPKIKIEAYKLACSIATQVYYVDNLLQQPHLSTFTEDPERRDLLKRRFMVSCSGHCCAIAPPHKERKTPERELMYEWGKDPFIMLAREEGADDKRSCAEGGRKNRMITLWIRNGSGHVISQFT